MRREWRHDTTEWADREVKAQNIYDEFIVPEAEWLDHQIGATEEQIEELSSYQQERNTWVSKHRDAASRLKAVQGELNPLSEVPQAHQELSRLLAPRHQLERPGVERGPDLGIDIGL
jgi:hypothetical protein